MQQLTPNVSFNWTRYGGMVSSTLNLQARRLGGRFLKASTFTSGNV